MYVFGLIALQKQAIEFIQRRYRLTRPGFVGPLPGPAIDLSATVYGDERSMHTIMGIAREVATSVLRAMPLGGSAC